MVRVSPFHRNKKTAEESPSTYPVEPADAKLARRQVPVSRGAPRASLVEPTKHGAAPESIGISNDDARSNSSDDRVQAVAKEPGRVVKASAVAEASDDDPKDAAGARGGFLSFLSSTLPRPYCWPTIWIDLLSNAHLLVLWSLYVFDYECNYKRRKWSNLASPWPQTDYMARVNSSHFDRFIFVVWTLQVLATVGVVHFHLTRPHHPKFYVGRSNRLAIACHIVGGSLADFGGYLGFVLGSAVVVKTSSLAGACLHIPSALWQSRNLHGRREVMQPLYYFLDLFLLVKYLDVWFENGSFASVVAMGYAVNVFALVRVFFLIALSIGMEYETSYDLVLILAVITNLPIVLGPTGCLQLVSVVFWWNVLLEVLLPGHRSLLQVNRAYADVFPDEFNGRPVDFAGELRKFRRIYDDDRVTVAHAAFHIIAGDNNTIEMEEVEELFEGWGLPDAKTVAKQVFDDADDNNDGVIDFDEFSKNLWFVWERIHAVGEAEKDEDGHLRPFYIQDLKMD